MKDPLICDRLNGNNKCSAGLFCNAGKDLFCFFLRNEAVVSQLSEDRRRYPQVYVCCHWISQFLSLYCD